ncbi:hypothetical protein [Halodesulfovibrio sp. MK-HDV]|uniref:hypothetical protein n=1 Tax=Halodesulfovibrio sp. MK-HDV TaxID=2599925 RepID=UPI0013704BE0|nr:hypothetical protein [Halodesulfovibrio sp. MK-HDV]KAF1074530.1 hypothetical protein MKHDV_02605 [Halodesulfovibrio sp. MK-HDV]
MDYRLDEFGRDKMFKALTDIFIIAVLIILIGLLFDSRQLKSLGGRSFLLLVNFAYSYGASYVFYCVNIYLPEQKKLVRHADLIATSIRDIKKYADLGEEVFNDPTNNNTYGNINILIKTEI